MKWIDAQQLHSWADRLNARQALPGLIGQLIRASAADISTFRFPTGDSAQIHGWDGRLTAEPDGHFRAFVPDGDSLWEFGVTKAPKAKAEADYEKRTKTPGQGVVPSDTTFVFVTPRTWEDAEGWAASKRESLIWKDVRVIDAVDIEDWLTLCPAVAATFARENNFTPDAGALSVDEFWDLYSRRFEPPLSEAVLLAGRSAQQQEIQSILATGMGTQRCKGDSLEEVLGFLCATIRSAEGSAQQFLKSRTLIIQTEEAARQLRDTPNLLFAVRGAAKGASGLLSEKHRVIVPVGRDDIRSSSAISLMRPTAHEMGEALQTMGFSPEKGLQLAHECGKSVTVLARRIPSGDPSPCEWRGDTCLIPALLAGAWDQSSDADKEVVAALANTERYQDAERMFRGYLKNTDGPLELVESVWAVRAPVDMFVQLSHLLQEDHWNALRVAANTVLGEPNPALELPPGERMYASLRKQTLAHSSWLRNGISTTLLILAALGEQNEVLIGTKSPQAFVNELITELPRLREDHRLLASLSHQLPMLMEAAPDPLLSALEHLLGGDGEKLQPIFQDKKDDYSPWANSPHTGVLWALELAGQDPKYLQRAASILIRLDSIDPGGSLSNRPIGSLHQLFSVWHPSTNAPHDMRIAVLANLTASDSPTAWRLILGLIPRQGELHVMASRPLFREAGASERETLTYPILFKTLSWIAERASELAALEPLRWAELIERLNQLRGPDRALIIEKLGRAVLTMKGEDRIILWKRLSEFTRCQRAHMSATWTLTEEEISALEGIQTSLDPEDSILKEQYLFTERLPDILPEKRDQLWEQIGEIRNEVIRKLLNEGGIRRVVQFASMVEAPRYVGASLGFVEEQFEELLKAIKLSDELQLKNTGFIASMSSAAFVKSGVTWSTSLRAALLSGVLQPDLIPELVEWWPHSAETWTWVAGFGPEVEEKYWQGKHAWNLQAVGSDLDYAVKRYLDFDRPEYVVDALGMKADDLSEDQWYDVLNAYDQRVANHPAVLQRQGLAYHVQQIFKSLQKRPTISVERLATFEYRFLPLLRDVLNDADPNSALDRYVAQNPHLFVDIITTVFRPASERGEPKSDSSPQDSARAQSSFRVLESFAHVPGSIDNSIDSQVLNGWVNDVRELARKIDRLEVAEQYIGKMLFHAPADPDDQIWPHKVVRQGLEIWQSSQIEQGLFIAKANARGVTSRGPFEGGTQERELAATFRGEAQKLSMWPRTRNLYMTLAQSYENHANREDIEAAQLRLRE